MVDLASLLKELSATEAREVAYILIRYFKTSSFLEPRGKDFFADIFDRASGEAVRRVTPIVIERIESDVGSPAAEFDTETKHRVLNSISRFERRLEAGKPLEVSEGVSSFLGRLRT